MTAGAQAQTYIVVGASGAGKDTLMRALAQRLDVVRLVRRTITRGSETGENFDGVSDAEFARRAARCDFLLHWQAHGLSYGIEKVALLARQPGEIILFNGSRGMVNEAMRKIAGLRVIHVTAETRVLANRLVDRGRELPKDIETRLARATLDLPAGPKVIEIDNSGSLDAAIDRLVQAVLAAYPVDERTMT